MKNNIKSKECEPCTSCGKNTEISINETDIRLRPGDLEDGRVLCERCFIKSIAMSSLRGNMTDEQKMSLIEVHANRRETRIGNRKLK